MFDVALVESRKTHALGGKRLGLPLAVGLHLAVIAAFVGASVWFTGEAPEAPIAVVFPAMSSAPPPPKGDGELTRNSRPSRPHPTTAASLPIRVPADSVAALTNVEEPSPTQDPSSEVAGPGRPDGVDHSTGPLDGERGDGDRRTQPILTPGGDVHAPVLLERIDPDFPEAARRAHLEGTLILEAVITASGAVQEVRVLRSLNPLLDEAAVRAVRQWRYRPATLNGLAVPVYLTVTVRFGIAS